MREEESDANCIFCKVVAGKIRANIVFDGSDTLFFHDIMPKAKIHILAIPKKHIGSLKDMVADDQAVMGKLMHEIAHVAEDLGLDAGYRVIINVGSNAGQEVPHLHVHILGGESLGPMRSRTK